MNENIDIRTTETGSRVVIRNLDTIASTADKAAASVDNLKNTLKFSSSNNSLRAITSNISALRTELTAMSGSGSYFTALKNAIDSLNNKASTIQKISTALATLNTSAANLTQFSRVLMQIGTNANTIDRVTQAVNRLGTALPILQQFKNELLAVVATTPQIQALAAALRGLGSIKGDLQALATGAKALSKELENASKYAQQTQQRLQSMGQSAKGSSMSLWDLRNSLAGVAVYLVASQVREWLDAWQSAAGLFKIATESMEQMHIVQQKVTDAAKETRQDFTSTTELYARLQRASQDVGASQEQMIKFTKGVGTVLAIQHTSANQARGALIQLGQALGMQNIRAQEFRSMNENLYVVLQTVAKNMDGMGGSVNKLRQKMLAGTLGSKEFFNAFLKGLPALQADFAKTSVTLSQAFTVMETNFISFIGHMDDSIGFSDKLGRAIIALSENLQYLIPIVVGVGVALAGAFGPAIIGYAISLTRVFWGILLSNPLVALAAGLATVATYLIATSNSTKIGTSSWIEYNKQCVNVEATVGNLATVIRDDLGERINNVIGFLDELAGKMAEAFYIKINPSDMTGQFDKGLIGLLERFTSFMTLMANSGETLGRVIGFSIVYGLDQISPKIATKMNEILGWAEEKLNKIKNLVGAVEGSRAITSVEVKIPKIEAPQAESFGKGIGDILSNAVNDAINSDATKWLKDMAQRAQKLAEENKKAQLKAQDELNVVPPATLAGDDKGAAKLLENMRKEFEKIQSLVDPIASAQREQNEAVKFLAKDLSAIGVTEAQRLEYAKLIEKHYKDAINPVNAMIEANKKEIDLLRMDPELRARALELEKQKEELRKKGVKDEEMQLDILRQQNIERAKAALISSAKEQIYAATVGKNQRQVADDTAVSEMMNDPNSKFGKTDARNYFMQQQPDLFAGTQEQIDAQMVAFQAMYMKIDQMRQLDVISEQTAAQMKRKVAAEETEFKYKNANDFFGNLASLSKSGNAKLAAIGKAAAIAQATIQGIVAVQNALAVQPYPVGLALAASAGIAAAANVAQIASTPTGFMTGGEFTVGGRGGADSQMVAFRATPGERVAVQTPQQYRKGDPGRDSGQSNNSGPMSIKVVNVLDPKLVGDYLATAQGEKLVMNIIQRNQSTIKSYSR